MQKLLARYDLRIIALALIFTYVISIVGITLFIDEPIQDFSAFYTSSQMVWQGLSDQVYDLNAYVAHTKLLFPEGGSYAWFYPPTTLLAITPLALLPPFVCYLIMVFGQLVLFGVLVYRYFRKLNIVLFTLAGSALLLNAIYSQFGILWASFLLLALQALKQGEQTKAGFWLAMLSLKPHYAIMIPFALVAAKQWRCIAVTSVLIVSMALTSLLVFGVDTWTAFWDALTLTSATMQDPEAFFGFNPIEMTNVFSFAQLLGLPIWLRWTFQGMVVVICGYAVFHTWQQNNYNFAWKAALLALATIISMPWSFTYDMVLLNLWLAYLLVLFPQRQGLNQNNNHGQLIVLWLLPLIILTLSLQEWFPDGMSNILLLWPVWIMWQMRQSSVLKSV